MEREGKTSHAGADRRAFKEYNDSLKQIPDEDTEEDAEEADHGEPDDDTAPPVRRKRELNKTQKAVKEARKHDRSVARVLYQRSLELLRRLQQQRRRRQEQLRRRVQQLARSTLINTWQKVAAGNRDNIQQQANAPPNAAAKTVGIEGYSEAEIMAMLS